MNVSVYDTAFANSVSRVVEYLQRQYRQSLYAFCVSHCMCCCCSFWQNEKIDIDS